MEPNDSKPIKPGVTMPQEGDKRDKHSKHKGVKNTWPPNRVDRSVYSALQALGKKSSSRDITQYLAKNEPYKGQSRNQWYLGRVSQSLSNYFGLGRVEREWKSGVLVYWIDNGQIFSSPIVPEKLPASLADMKCRFCGIAINGNRKAVDWHEFGAHREKYLETYIKEHHHCGIPVSQASAMQGGINDERLKALSRILAPMLAEELQKKSGDKSP